MYRYRAQHSPCWMVLCIQIVMSELSNTAVDLFLCSVSRLHAKEVTGIPKMDTENQYRDTVSHENRRLNASISNTYIIGHLSSCERGLRLILTIRLAGSRQSSVSCLPEHSSISFARSHCRPAFHMTFSILGKNVLTGSANLCNTVWTDPRWSPVFRRQN